MANGSRLDAELGQGFALITTDTPASEDRVLVEQRGAIAVVAEPDSELAGWLRRGHATSVIVRPDRAVMWAGRDVSALCRAMPDFASDRAQLEDFA
jgi:3-(3-hydroxy-phenyl)propionate hydroxylase